MPRAENPVPLKSGRPNTAGSTAKNLMPLSPARPIELSRASAPTRLAPPEKKPTRDEMVDRMRQRADNLSVGSGLDDKPWNKFDSGAKPVSFGDEQKKREARLR